MKKIYIVLIVLIIVIVSICLFTFLNNKTTTQNEAIELKEVNNVLANKTADEFADLNNDDEIIYNIDNRPGAGIVDYAFEFEKVDLLKEYAFLNRIYIPDYLVLGSSGKNYNKMNYNKETGQYDKLENPEFIQNVMYFDSKDESNSLRPMMSIIFSTNDLALDRPFYHEGSLDALNSMIDSTIAGIKVKLFKTSWQGDLTKCNGELYFEYNGSKYYVEMNHFDEDEIDKVVISFVTEVRKGL